MLGACILQAQGLVFHLESSLLQGVLEVSVQSPWQNDAPKIWSPSPRMCLEMVFQEQLMIGRVSCRLNEA